MALINKPQILFLDEPTTGLMLQTILAFILTFIMIMVGWIAFGLLDIPNLISTVIILLGARHSVV